MGLYLALLLADDVEPTAPEYRRRPLEFEAAGADYVNCTLIAFPEPRQTWGTVIALAIMENLTGGSPLLKIELPRSCFVDAHGQVEVPARSIVIPGPPPRRTIWQLLKETDAEVV